MTLCLLRYGLKMQIRHMQMSREIIGWKRSCDMLLKMQIRHIQMSNEIIGWKRSCDMLLLVT